MPLTADFEHHGPIDATNVSDELWHEIYVAKRKEFTPRCRGCGGKMHPKALAATHRRFFAHNPDTSSQHCAHAIESAKHLGLKDALATAARSHGYTVDLEVPVDGGRCDVVVRSSKGAYVFEAQVSTLSPTDANRRQGIYTEQFGAAAWWTTLRSPKFRAWVPTLQVDDEFQNVVRGIIIDERREIHAQPLRLDLVTYGVLSGRFYYIWDERTALGDDEQALAYFRDRESLRKGAGIKRRRNNRSGLRPTILDYCAVEKVLLTPVQEPLFLLADLSAPFRVVTPSCICEGPVRAWTPQRCPICGSHRG